MKGKRSIRTTKRKYETRFENIFNTPKKDILIEIQGKVPLNKLIPIKQKAKHND